MKSSNVSMNVEGLSLDEHQKVLSWLVRLVNQSALRCVDGNYLVSEITDSVQDMLPKGIVPTAVSECWRDFCSILEWKRPGSLAKGISTLAFLVREDKTNSVTTITYVAHQCTKNWRVDCVFNVPSWLYILIDEATNREAQK